MARGAKAREYDYSAVGTQGRRTGITLKEGKRDEHGMEEVDGLFSSPEKSPAEVDGFDDRDLEDSMGSDGMSMDEGNAPGPMDFLNAANASRPALLPPPGRSPAKGFASSTRRSPVLRSTPDQEEDLLSPSPSDGKGLTKTHGSRQEPSPLTTRSVNAGVSKQRNNAQKATKAQLVAPESPVVHDFSDGEGDENANSFLPEDNDFGDSFDAGNETVIPDDDVPEPLAQDQSDAENDSPRPAEDVRSAPKTSTTASKPTKKALTAKASKPEKSETKSGRRGRPPKNSRTLDEESADARPSKRQKIPNSQPQANRKPLDPELNKVVENYTQRSGPLKGRSLYILKRENPTDQSSTHTRSGRASIRPLAYWRNERCVYGDGEAEEGQRFPLSTIKEIVRAEELEPERTKKGKRAGRKSKSKKQAESSDNEDEHLDVWEKESGVLHGFVPRWDPKSQTSTKEEDVIDIAYAPSGIETREVKDSTFRFAKLLSSSFIGSGVVELPPEGVKRPKNSKKMHMVFYVCHGRVQVDISGVQFSAGKGCVFQVPRGNYYSFQNAHSKEARLFFTQGCVPGEDEIAASRSRNAVQESEFEGEGTGEGEAEPENDPTPVIKKARGRPKGKQKAK
ncbi:uncharacterized protein N7484_005608 [Penicillium longicatenatum]|uniref:uncharacterized protein n=1 Tax=Penicillium longicatenatum TaxID=1561947 RepID=UPI0025481879|nr:uncharacterized protein N7484_005608 [Penicillium longicatenatum]KAJ5643101.1 hypothetical protein N7484_005608 [Penicillium longicatenatum]